MSVLEPNTLLQIQQAKTPLFIQFANSSLARSVCEQIHGDKHGRLKYLDPNLFETDELFKSYMFSGGSDLLSNFQDCIDGTLIFENIHLTSINTQKVLRTFFDIVERKQFRIFLIFLSSTSLECRREAGLMDLPFYYRIIENVLDITLEQ